MRVEHPFFTAIWLPSGFWLDGIVSESFNKPEQSGLVGSSGIVLRIEPPEE
jgi:hypothetical protein